MSLPPVDLRSDTVTRPTPAMRRAIAEAAVGDDVFGDDPTVIELEERVATLAGKQAALFVPSGTMGNQIAIGCHTTPGDLVLIESRSHVFLFEQGGLAANSGCLAQVIETLHGTIEPAQVTAAIRDHGDDHVSRLALVCLENTHNWHGGRIVAPADFRAVAGAARERGIRVHLDGARLWNAVVASGVPVREWAAEVDTLMMCFSKGLGAPVGSILVGDAAVIRRGRRLRKRLGGGMRQAGILAAACLHALDHHVERLAEDHARARTLAAAFRMAPGVSVIEPDTNIVMADLAAPGPDAAWVVAALAERGVRMSVYGPRRVRATTHLDVDDAGIARAGGEFRAVLENGAAGAARGAGRTVDARKGAC